MTNREAQHIDPLQADEVREEFLHKRDNLVCILETALPEFYIVQRLYHHMHEAEYEGVEPVGKARELCVIEQMLAEVVTMIERLEP